VSLGEQLGARFRAEHAFFLVTPRKVGRDVLLEFVSGAAPHQWNGPALYTIVSDDEFAADYVDSPLLHHEAQRLTWWWVDQDDLDQRRADEWREILATLWTQDIFNERNPVPVSGGMLDARWREGMEIAQEIHRGRSLGCFGLRKVGKTSTLRDACESVDRHSSWGRNEERAVWVDVQGLPLRTLDGLCTAILTELGADDRAATSSLQRLDEALTQRAEAGRPSWLALDEYDLLFSNGRGRSVVEGIERFFSMLRAHAQRHRLLSLVVIGRDPSHAQRPMMEGVPNPLLGWLSTRWIGPLVETDARSLFATLSRRVCLDAGPATLEAALRWSGGHPMLLRQFGSALLSVAGASIRSTGPLPTDPFVERAIDAFLERDAVLEMCREVEHALAEVYTDAGAAFWKLIEAPSSNDSEAEERHLRTRIEEHGGWRSPAIQTLRNLGLLQGPSEAAGDSAPLVVVVVLRDVAAERDGGVSVPPNPYRWDGQTPRVEVPRTARVAQVERLLLQGSGVTLLAGRGMGKSVLLRQVEHALRARGDVCVVRFPAPPIPRRSVVDCLNEVARARCHDRGGGPRRCARAPVSRCEPVLSLGLSPLRRGRPVRGSRRRRASLSPPLQPSGGRAQGARRTTRGDGRRGTRDVSPALRRRLVVHLARRACGARRARSRWATSRMRAVRVYATSDRSTFTTSWMFWSAPGSSGAKGRCVATPYACAPSRRCSTSRTCRRARTPSTRNFSETSRVSSTISTRWPSTSTELRRRGRRSWFLSRSSARSSCSGCASSAGRP
jgi:hypothetical protein